MNEHWGNLSRSTSCCIVMVVWSGYKWKWPVGNNIPISFLTVTSTHARQCLFTKAQRARCQLQRRCVSHLPPKAAAAPWETTDHYLHMPPLPPCKARESVATSSFFVCATMCPLLKSAGTGRRMHGWPLPPIGTHLSATSPGSSKPVRLVSPGRLYLEWCGPCEQVLWNMRE